ncbi:hypothetical protein [Halobacillus sp. H74]|uniref:hypothetical protein n=1 Tax=Halobacillus sp. H74 TaxID=3457436 RepID=UPI003FCCCFD9
MRKDVENRLERLEASILNEIHILGSDNNLENNDLLDEIEVLEETLDKVVMLRSMLNNFMVPDVNGDYEGFENVIMDLEKALDKPGVNESMKGPALEDCEHVDPFQVLM